MSASPVIPTETDDTYRLVQSIERLVRVRRRELRRLMPRPTADFFAALERAHPLPEPQKKSAPGGQSERARKTTKDKSHAIRKMPDSQ